MTFPSPDCFLVLEEKGERCRNPRKKIEEKQMPLYQQTFYHMKLLETIPTYKEWINDRKSQAEYRLTILKLISSHQTSCHSRRFAREHRNCPLPTRMSSQNAYFHYFNYLSREVMVKEGMPLDNFGYAAFDY